MTDLFGNKIIDIKTPKKKKGKTLFDDYDSFVDKFEVKKTTDDCYTPKEVYDCVLQHVVETFDIREREIIRPFFPGGDYESVDYPEGCVVVDNPPFSIFAKIVNFYTKRGIKFYLFAPHLTLLSAVGNNDSCTAVIVSHTITYENGAKINTSFVTNMYDKDVAIVGDVVLYKKLKQVAKERKSGFPNYQYPANVLTASMVNHLVLRETPIQFNREDVYFIRELDSQKKYKKAIFGAGFLLSDEAAAKKAIAEKVAEVAEVAEEKKSAIVWELSERELKIIKSMKC
jgi:hypothetical protein